MRQPFLTWLADSGLQRTRPPWLVCGVRLSRVDACHLGSEAARDMLRPAVAHKSLHRTHRASHSRSRRVPPARRAAWVRVGIGITGRSHSHGVSQDELAVCGRGKKQTALRPPFQGCTSRTLCRCQAVLYEPPTQSELLMLLDHGKALRRGWACGWDPPP